MVKAELEGFFNFIAREKAWQKRRQTAGVEAFTTADDFVDGPPPEPEVIFIFEVDSL